LGLAIEFTTGAVVGVHRELAGIGADTLEHLLGELRGGHALQGLEVRLLAGDLQGGDAEQTDCHHEHRHQHFDQGEAAGPCRPRVHEAGGSQASKGLRVPSTDPR